MAILHAVIPKKQSLSLDCLCLAPEKDQKSEKAEKRTEMNSKPKLGRHPLTEGEGYYQITSTDTDADGDDA